MEPMEHCNYSLLGSRMALARYSLGPLGLFVACNDYDSVHQGYVVIPRNKIVSRQNKERRQLVLAAKLKTVSQALASFTGLGDSRLASDILISTRSSWLHGCSLAETSRH